jgi:hypothetical protein
MLGPPPRARSGRRGAGTPGRPRRGRPISTDSPREERPGGEAEGATALAAPPHHALQRRTLNETRARSAPVGSSGRAWLRRDGRSASRPRKRGSRDHRHSVDNLDPAKLEGADGADAFSGTAVTRSAAATTRWLATPRLARRCQVAAPWAGGTLGPTEEFGSSRMQL